MHQIRAGRRSESPTTAVGPAGHLSPILQNQAPFHAWTPEAALGLHCGDLLTRFHARFEADRATVCRSRRRGGDLLLTAQAVRTWVYPPLRRYWIILGRFSHMSLPNWPEDVAGHECKCLGAV